MFIAHLPAAFIALKTAPIRLAPQLTVAFLIGSVLPDSDLAYFYLLDGRQHHHHDYFTHRPMLWITLLLISFVVTHHGLRAITALSSGALLHLLLDSISGKIGWLWPLSDWAEPVIPVPATHDHWVMSFLTHWTFKVEIAITLIAIIVAFRATKNPAQRTGFLGKFLKKA